MILLNFGKVTGNNAVLLIKMYMSIFSILELNSNGKVEYLNHQCFYTFIQILSGSTLAWGIQVLAILVDKHSNMVRDMQIGWLVEQKYFLLHHLLVLKAPLVLRQLVHNKYYLKKILLISKETFWKLSSSLNRLQNKFDVMSMENAHCCVFPS